MAKIEIKVCLGTSCFAKGSVYLQEIKEAVEKNFSSEDIEVSGVPCLGLCAVNWENSKAPYIKVNDDIVTEATPEKVLTLLQQKLS